MTENDAIVIVGGGHAGAALCAALVDEGLRERVHLVCAEPELPYHRPPLSKSYWRNRDEPLQLHRNGSWYSDAGIRLVLGDPVTEIDRKRREVRMRSGRSLTYGHLVLATGSSAKWLPDLPPGLANVLVLRTARDALRLRHAIDPARELAVIGAGLIGLEVAATARRIGKATIVLEAAHRVLSRCVSPEVAEHALRTHQAAGIDVRLGMTVEAFEITRNRVVALTVGGRRLSVDLLLLGIGAAPEVRLAREAGLACGDGVSVDTSMRTSDPAILAIGDCASFPDSLHGGALRLESVQNASDQARCAAATLAGRERPYCPTPSFWSDQAGLRLQVIGSVRQDTTRHLRPGATPNSFSILHYLGERLVCVESVNAPVDHLGARRLLQAGRSPGPAQACDTARRLISFL